MMCFYLAADHALQMMEPDVVTFVNMITFIPDEADREGKTTIFEYVVAEDYENTLVALEAIN